MRVGIVGGGVAGLAAAYRLLQAGHAVELFEAGPEFGGQVRTFEIGGGRIECFYHHLFRSDTSIIALIDELGLGDELTWRDSRVGFYHDGRLYPFVTPLDLLRFSPLPVFDRLRLGLAGLYLRWQKDWRRYESQTAKDWIIRHVGRRNYDVVWGPLLRGKFGERADEVGMTWFWGKIHVRFQSRGGGPLQREQLGYLTGSFGRYLDRLIERIREMGGALHAGAPVARVVVEDGRARGIELPAAEGESSGRRVDCDAVLATTPSRIFERIVPELPEPYARLLGRVQYQWATCLVLALKRPLTPFYWLNISDPAIPFVAAVEQTNFIEPERYGGNHVLYLSNYVDEGSPIVRQGVDEVYAQYAPHLQKINPAFDESWVSERWLFKDMAGQPIIGTDYLRSIPEHRTPIPGLYLANTTQIYPEDRGQNYSIRMGEQVARMILDDTT